MAANRVRSFGYTRPVLFLFSDLKVSKSEGRFTEFTVHHTGGSSRMVGAILQWARREINGVNFSTVHLARYPSSSSCERKIWAPLLRDADFFGDAHMDEKMGSWSHVYNCRLITKCLNCHVCLANLLAHARWGFSSTLLLTESKVVQLL